MTMNSFPPSWVAVKLGDICEIERGVTFPSDAQASEPSEKHIACLRTTNVQERVEWEDLIYIPRSYAQDENKQVRQNDILISIANSKELVGKVAFVEKVEIEALFGGFISIIRATDLIDPYYLYSFLRATSTQEKLRSVSNQTTNIANLTVKEINRFPIPLPPLPEQRRIADVLHKADALHQWRHNANDKYEELLRALFIQMFGDPYANPKGWEIVSVESLKHPNKPVIRTGPFGSSLKKHEYTQQGIPVWGIDNVKPNEFVEQNSLFVSATKFLQLRNYEVNDGDVLISRAGTTGRMCVANPKQSPSIIGTNLIRLSLDQEKILPEFFTTMFTFLGDRVARTLRASGESDAYSFINPKDLKSLKVILPNIELQREFFVRLDKIRTINADQKISEKKLNSLMQSLLVRAFTGELTENWREKHKDELQRSAVERDKTLGMRSEKARLIDFKEGRVTPEELEGLRKVLGNFAVNLASYHIDVDGLARSLEEITKPLTQSLVSMSQNLLTPFLESFRQSLQNIQLALPVPPDEDEINRQIDLLPLPQEKRTIHDLLDVTSLRVLKLAHASPAYFTSEDLTFGGITSTHTSTSLRVLDSLGFVRLVEIDGVLRYHVIDANTDTALKPDQLQQ